MSDTVTAVYQVVCGSSESYALLTGNLIEYEADPTNPPVTDKVLDEPNLTIRYTVTTVLNP